MRTGSHGQQGRHRVERAEADLLFFHIHGDIVNLDVEWMMDLEKLVRTECGYSLVIADVSDMGTFTPATRKHAAALMEADRNYIGSTAILGSSFLTRTLISLVLRAVALLTKRLDKPMDFFGTRQAALDWSFVQRAEFSHR